MKYWLEIERRGGVIDRREIRAGVLFGEAEGKCPGCGVDQFLIAGTGVQKHYELGTVRAGGRSLCCGENVGWIYAQSDSIFGKEEDERMIGENRSSRCRVYT